MITCDHLGQSSVLNFHISYIEDNACFKFRGIGGFPLFLKLPASIILFLFLFLFMSSVFRFFFSFFRFFFFVELVLG